MARTPREVWEKRIQRLRDSELTDTEFAGELGVNVHTLRSWKWKLKTSKPAEPRQRTSKPARARRRRTAKAPSAATFVEMEVAPTDVASGIELRVRDIDVRVPIGFDEATLSRVVAVLRQSA